MHVPKADGTGTRCRSEFEFGQKSRTNTRERRRGPTELHVGTLDMMNTKRSTPVKEPGPTPKSEGGITEGTHTLVPTGRVHPGRYGRSILRQVEIKWCSNDARQFQLPLLLLGLEKANRGSSYPRSHGRRAAMVSNNTTRDTITSKKIRVRFRPHAVIEVSPEKRLASRFGHWRREGIREDIREDI